MRATQHTCVRGSRARWAGSGDRASADVLFVLPIVFVMVLGVVQTGMWAHAQHRAQTIAAQALSTARAHDGSAEAARGRAEQAREQLGGDLLHQVRVEVDRDATRARVQVRAQTFSLLSGWSLPVHAQVSGPVEHLTAEPGR